MTIPDVSPDDEIKIQTLAEEYGLKSFYLPSDLLFRVPGVEIHRDSCPDCGTHLSFGEGCAMCHCCGFSRCG